jgi:hypothetical protein
MMFTKILTLIHQIKKSSIIYCVHRSASEAIHQLLENQTVEKDTLSTADQAETLTSYIQHQMKKQIPVFWIITGRWRQQVSLKHWRSHYNPEDEGHRIILLYLHIFHCHESLKSYQVRMFTGSESIMFRAVFKTTTNY